MIIPKRVPVYSGIIATVVFAGACAGSLFGQAAPAAAPGSSGPADTVSLSPFVVSEGQVGRYQSTEATSGGRVRVNVFDASQSISVIPLDLMLDISSTRVLDAAKYVSGITESILPGGLDRTTIRGFQQDGTTVDGFNAGNQQGNIDPILVERMEIVKGPNAVLAPTNGNAPGGTINLVTRKPQFRNFGSLSYQLARWDGNRATLDFNRVFGTTNNWAFRVVGAAYDTEIYSEVPIKNTTIMPMLTWRSKTGAQLTAQFEYFHFHNQNYLGLPVDPSIGSTGADAKIWSILRRDLNLSDNDYRDDQRKEGRLLLTAPLTDGLNMRLAARYAKTAVAFGQNIPGPALGTQTGGAVNPLTGLYTPGFIYGPGPTYTASAAAPAATVLGRNGNNPRTWGPVFNIQNDYVHEFKNSFVTASTLGGVAFNYSRLNNLAINADRPTINYAAPAAGLDFVERNPATSATAIAGRAYTLATSQQLYLSETLKAWGDRVSLNGSYSYNNFDTTINNLVPVVPTAAIPVPQQRFVGNIDTQLRSWGAVVKPIPTVVFYYGYSENTAVNNPGATGATSIAASNVALSLQAGKQREYGVRWEGLAKKLFVTLSRFDIKQSGFSVPNPGNLVVPQPVPLLPALITDRAAKGWELEVRANLTKNFSVIGNVTDFTNRDPNGKPFRGTAEKSWAMLGSYQFEKGTPLFGLNLALGFDHLDRRPGDAPGGPVTITPATGTPYIVAPGPTFWLEPRTLVHLSAGYKVNDHWSIQLNVDNLLDKEYIAAAVNRGNIMPGTPINPKFKVTYSF